MGILLVYDVTDEASFNNIRNWMRNIEQHASDNVNKVHAVLLLRFERAIS
jgi:Ras-related protein Rab-8A